MRARTPGGAYGPLGCSILIKDVQINAVVMGCRDVFAFAPSSEKDWGHIGFVILNDLLDAEGAVLGRGFTENGAFPFLHSIMHNSVGIIRFA